MNFRIVIWVLNATIVTGIAILLIGLGMYIQAQQDAITLSKLMNDSASKGTILKDNEHFYTVSYYLNINRTDLSAINLTLIPCCEVKK